MKTADIKVDLIDHMGSDLSVVNAARVSFDKVSDWVWRDVLEQGEMLTVFELSDKDAKLIRYLAKHNHFTPFCHAFTGFRIKAPIFVARQLVKHQVGLAWNEESRRYIDSEPEFYIPKEWRKRADNVKQGSSNETVWCVPLGADEDLTIGDLVRGSTNCALEVYNGLLQGGVAPEQARMVLPQNTMTNWIWSGSLMAFARVCKLRLDPHAQLETRLVAEQIADHMSRLWPVSWSALMEN